MKAFGLLLAGLLWASVDGAVFAKPSTQFLSFAKDNVMLLSNQPESISEPGLIYSGDLPTSTRLLYYHKSVIKSPLRFSVSLTNCESRPIYVKIAKAINGPSKDGLFVGHRVSMAFLQKGLRHDFDRIQLAPGECRAIITHAMKYDEVISGLAKIMKHGSDRVVLKMQVLDSDMDGLSGLDYAMGAQGYECGYYVAPYRFQAVSLNMSSPVCELPLGHEPFIMDQRTGVPLKGNYGVVYSWVINLHNSMPNRRSFSLYFAPLGGMARSGIVVDDVLFETKLVDHRSEHRPQKVLEWSLLPGEKRRVVVSALPQAGSFYPVNLVVTHDGPKYVNGGLLL